ncbi:AbrB family transcriptional regulator [Pararhodospirillum photometricum]|nr:AbrB family transcriptional regulator [Pararhodospirillum photometricum]
MTVPPRFALEHWPRAGQGLALVGLSAGLMIGMDSLALPGSLLLGAMLAAVAVAAGGASLRVGRVPFLIAQGVVASVLAERLPGAVLVEMGRVWPLIVAGVVGVLATSTLMGWVLARARVLPGTTALWGSTPGAASAMVLMAEAHGADARLVAFMQFLRVLMVALAASLVAGLWAPGAMETAGPGSLFARLGMPLRPVDVLAPLTLAVVGVAAGRWTPLPGAPFLVPLALGLLAEEAWGLSFVVPGWLAGAAYVLIGWTIGLRFTRALLRHVVQVFPRVALSILALMLVCGGLAALLVFGADIDPLTAYLATSPGGIDAMAVIAATSHADLPFVVAMQTGRFLVVLLVGPLLSRLMARHALPLTPVA